MEIIFYVYRLVSKGKSFYIGKGTKTESYNRINYHLNYWKNNKNLKLVNKIKKLNGKFNIEIIFESSCEQECLDLEKKIISQIGIENLCNLTKGGEGISGFKHSEDTKHKISIWRKGKPLSGKTCKKISKSKKGNKYKINNIPEGKIEELYKNKSIHEIANILGLSPSTIRNYLREINLYIPNKNRSSMLTQSRKKISKAKKGKRYKLKEKILDEIEELYKNKPIQEIANILNLSFSTVKKALMEKNLYIPYKNKKVSNKTKNKMSQIMKGKNNKGVLQLDLEGNIINRFKSLTEACEYMNKPNRQGDITACCKGKQITAWGYKWKYKN